MSDVKLFQTENDGDIDIINGSVVMSEDPSSAAYISLFGGNMNGSAWWGDSSLISNTQTLLDELPPTSGNLLRLESAVTGDLLWMTQPPYNWSVSASARIISVSRVEIIVTISGTAYKFETEWTQ